LDDMPNNEKGRRKADDKGNKCDDGLGWQCHWYENADGIQRITD
jgi:hypothetical protein